MLCFALVSVQDDPQHDFTGMVDQADSSAVLAVLGCRSSGGVLLRPSPLFGFPNSPADNNNNNNNNNEL